MNKVITQFKNRVRLFLATSPELTRKQIPNSSNESLISTDAPKPNLSLNLSLAASFQSMKPKNL